VGGEGIVRWVVEDASWAVLVARTSSGGGGIREGSPSPTSEVTPRRSGHRRASGAKLEWAEARWF